MDNNIPCCMAKHDQIDTFIFLLLFKVFSKSILQDGITMGG